MIIPKPLIRLGEVIIATAIIVFIPYWFGRLVQFVLRKFNWSEDSLIIDRDVAWPIGLGSGFILGILLLILWILIDYIFLGRDDDDKGNDPSESDDTFITDQALNTTIINSINNHSNN